MISNHLKNLREHLPWCCIALLGAACHAGAAAAASASPFDNVQASLAINLVMPTSGTYPSRSDVGLAQGNMLGFVYGFAGGNLPSGSLRLDGQVEQIALNPLLFSLMGTQYGGNGTTQFNIPNLTGQALLGAGSGMGLTPHAVGESVGAPRTTLSSDNLPAPQGIGQPFNNVQPSLSLTPLIATTGLYPGGGGSAGNASFLGQIAYFSDNYAPGGWSLANGALLPIAQNEALFSIIGTTYGGDGISTFALPDLQGRVAVGATGTQTLGGTYGTETITMTQAIRDGEPFNNQQPSLSVSYLIALSGLYPGQSNSGLDDNQPILGQISTFAGNYAPSGWALANGQMLSIAQNLALFSLLGTQYGGDGRTTFALPDFRGRTAIGADGDSLPAGTVIGRNEMALAPSQLPAVPEPPMAMMLLLGLGLLTRAARGKTPGRFSKPLCSPAA